MNKVHFIAIGGSAMHNLALALHEKGYQVTGSDDAVFDPSKSRLEAEGLLPKTMGWFPEKITTDLEAIILGMHARKDNPELLKAQELGLKIYSYPEYLYEQSKEKTRVVIGGSHGKTTITSMILHTLNYHSFKTDYMVGAQLEGFKTMVKLTKENEFMVLEGDEYLSSPIDLRSKFIHYKPNIALISGIAWDHINVFPTFKDYTKQFNAFTQTITEGGALVYNKLDEEVVKVVEAIETPMRLFPYEIPSHSIENGKTILQTEEGDIPLKIFGDHNLMNLEGARNICNLMGLTDEQFYEAIMSFTGASRRLELLKETSEYTVFKDFAHAPSKVKSVVKAVNKQFAEHTKVACLELHTYSSLNPEFLVQYKDALAGADCKIVFYSPKALEIKKMQPISPEDIKEAFNDPNLQVYTTPNELQLALQEIDKKQVVFLMMSSGNYGGLNLKEVIS